MDTYANIDSLFNYPELKEMTEYEQATIVALAAMAHVKGKFRTVFCTEYDQCEWPEQLAYDMVPTRSFTVGMESGDYICCEVGPGWFAWGIGCPLASALMEYFADESISPWTDNATGQPNVTRKVEVDRQYAAYDAIKGK